MSATMWDDPRISGVVISPPTAAPAPERWWIEYSAGEVGDPWERVAVPFRSFAKASALLSHLSRAYPSCLNAHRIVDAAGRTVVLIAPGAPSET